MLFICGCSRSGTTTFADFMNAHGQIAMGRERYVKWLRLHKRLPPELFEKERFCRNVHPDDGHHNTLLPVYEKMASRFDDFVYFGDKIPNLFLHFDAIRADYPDAKIIFLLRNIHDVASSHEKRRQRSLQNPKSKWPLWRDAFNAVEEWNGSLKAIQDLGDDLETLVVDYDRLYMDRSLMAGISDFLDLPVTAGWRDFWKEAAKDRQAIDRKPRNNLTQEHLAHIESQADFGNYRKLLDRM